MLYFKTLELFESLLDLPGDPANAWLTAVSIKDGISQFLLSRGMTLSLSKCLCVSFHKLAGIEINLEGEKGGFYSRL